MEKEVLRKIQKLCCKHNVNPPNAKQHINVSLIESLFWKICESVLIDDPIWPRNPVRRIQSMIDFISQEILHYQLDYLDASLISSNDFYQLNRLFSLFEKIDACLNSPTSSSSNVACGRNPVACGRNPALLKRNPKMRSVLYSPKTTWRKYPTGVNLLPSRWPNNLSSIRKPKPVRNPFSQLEEAVMKARQCSPAVKNGRRKLINETVERLMNSPTLQSLLSPKPNRMQLANERRHELLAVKQAKLVLRNAEHKKVYIKARVASQLQDKLFEQFKENQNKASSRLREETRAREAIARANSAARAQLIQELSTANFEKPMTVIDKIKLLENM